MPEYFAIDLGAESGRLVRGSLDGGLLRLEEAARFRNEMIRVHGHLYWNLLGMFADMKRAMRSLSDSSRPESLGVDSWGVDFVLLAADGAPAGLPAAYRDSRTHGMMEKFFELVPREQVYRKTGIQFMQLNTLYQLFAMSQLKSPQLACARDLLFIPDFFHFLFTGEKHSESTIASTSQLLNIEERTWDAGLVIAAGVSPELFQNIVPPGTMVGRLTDEMREETGLGRVPVIAPASHDTASAVAAVPAEGHDWAYISSGTWSLMGIETPEPILTNQALGFNFTNEGGVNGTFRFLKNIMGLWPVQRIRAELGGKHDYGDLTRMAAEYPAFVSLINMEDSRFHNPASMLAAISDFCRETGQLAPGSPGAFVRCSLESLALHYRVVLEQLLQVQSSPINRIHVVGGGSRNSLLRQMTADATGLPVLSGPMEATSIGNLIVQAQALGHIGSLDEARAIVRRSFEIKEYEPSENDAWESALERYKKIIK